MRAVKSGNGWRPASRDASMSPRRPGQRPATELLPPVFNKRSAVFSMADRNPTPRRDSAPHFYGATNFPPPMVSSGEDTRPRSEKNPRKTEAARSAHEDTEAFEHRLATLEPAGKEATSARRQAPALDKKVGSGLALASAKTLSAAAQGRLHDVTRLNGLFIASQPWEIAHEYRLFCRVVLPECQPAETTGRVQFDNTANASEDNHGAHQLNWAQVLKAPQTYGGPLDGAVLQKFLKFAALRRADLHLSDAYVKEIADGLMTHNAFALSPFTEDRVRQTNGAQYHSNANLRFSHSFSLICDALADSHLQRNAALFLAAFDPSNSGRVPQHALLSASFVRKYVAERVWPGAADQWYVVCDSLDAVNRKRESEDTADDYHDVSPFTWAVETFVGQYDRYRSQAPGGYSLRIFGVPTTCAKAVIFATPELCDALQRCNLSQR
jgi:hypothetical protein